MEQLLECGFFKSDFKKGYKVTSLTGYTRTEFKARVFGVTATITAKRDKLFYSILKVPYAFKTVNNYCENFFYKGKTFVPPKTTCK